MMIRPAHALLALAILGSLHGAPASEPAIAFRAQLGAERAQKLETRLGELNHDIAKRGIRMFGKFPEPMLTGYAYEEFYDWDLYFESIYLSYYGKADVGLANFRAFMSIQKPNGYISRMLQRQQTKHHFKPFLAQMAVLGTQQLGGDYEWLRASYFEQLGRYLDRWFWYDNDNNGLPMWNSADSSGMDNQDSRAGKIDTFQCEGVDLACYLHRELQAMAFIAGKLGKPEVARAYTGRATALAALINKTFWDETDGFYYDRSERTGKPIRIKTISGFIPLWAGIASPKQAERLVREHLTNEKTFWLKYPIATYAATEPDYYQGVKSKECNWRGTAWIPTNYMIMHGLVDYGFNDIARELADRTFRLVLDENPTTREFYDADTGKGNGMNPFWGWSSLGYAMPLELATGHNPMKFEGELRSLFSRHLGVAWPTSPNPSASR